MPGPCLDVTQDAGRAMLVRQASVDTILAWNCDAEYLKGIGHPSAGGFAIAAVDRSHLIASLPTKLAKPPSAV